MNYEDKYGERVLSDEQEEKEREKIEEQEHLENIDKCIKKINEILSNKELDKEVLIEKLEELKDLTEEF